MRTPLWVVALTLIACGPGPVVGPPLGGGGGSTGGGGGAANGGGSGGGGQTASDAGDTDAGEQLDAGENDAGTSDAGAVLPDLGWGFIGIPGSQCALGSQAGIGYNSGATDELMIFLQGG